MKTPLVTRGPEGLPLGAVRRGSVSPEGGKRVRKWSSRATGERLKWIGARPDQRSPWEPVIRARDSVRW